ncbi:MAG TPA: hypothetical protein VFR23_16400 [Jiangellaceae bacterium]|nr:hypothetical protein [Jiangellaceae bacterium]
MARRPADFTWIGFTPEQVELLEFLDHLGNNGLGEEQPNGGGDAQADAGVRRLVLAPRPPTCCLA